MKSRDSLRINSLLCGQVAERLNVLNSKFSIGDEPIGGSNPPLPAIHYLNSNPIIVSIPPAVLTATHFLTELSAL